MTTWNEWLPHLLNRWAREWLRAFNGGYAVANHDGTMGWHADGVPLSSVAAIAKDSERGPTDSARPSQHFSEVYSKDGLLVRRAMEGMPIDCRQVLYAMYLCRGSHKQRMHALGLTKTRYWELNQTAHAWIAARLPLLDGEPAAKPRKQVASCPDKKNRRKSVVTP